MKTFAHIAAFSLLTALTQVGGVVYLLAICLGRFLKLQRVTGAWPNAVLFIAIYAGATLFVVPPMAALSGRVRLPCTGETLQSLPILCALNRNYVDQRLAKLADALANDITRGFPGTVTIALDGNFPFLNGFPLLPHFSHDDGLKLDLAYYYDAPDGTYIPGATRSPIGYWAFEQPGAGEEPNCPATWLTARWNMAALQPLFPVMPMDVERTRAALDCLFANGAAYGLERVFIEPYLAKRLGVASPLLGFQGCRAARHDDHIHIQIGAQ